MTEKLFFGPYILTSAMEHLEKGYFHKLPRYCDNSSCILSVICRRSQGIIAHVCDVKLSTERTSYGAIPMLCIQSQNKRATFHFSVPGAQYIGRKCKMTSVTLSYGVVSVRHMQRKNLGLQNVSYRSQGLWKWWAWT